MVQPRAASVGSVSTPGLKERGWARGLWGMPPLGEVGLRAKQGGQRGCGRNKGSGLSLSSDPKLLPASPMV